MSRFYVLQKPLVSATNRGLRPHHRWVAIEVARLIGCRSADERAYTERSRSRESDARPARLAAQMHERQQP
jgi:hypothetical protein